MEVEKADVTEEQRKIQRKIRSIQKDLPTLRLPEEIEQGAAALKVLWEEVL